MTKVECNKEGTNVRHVVTSMYMKSPKEIYERFYCKRGDCELYIKELKNGLGADRVSCANFADNQFRLFLHAAAYVLLLETKQILFRGCELSHATISTFREKVIPYRCTYQRVQDKNQSRVCQRPSHKGHDEDGTPKSIVKRLTYYIWVSLQIVRTDISWLFLNGPCRFSHLHCFFLGGGRPKT